MIWETETNPHIDVHKPPHVAYSPRAMQWCVSPMDASTRLCFVGQVTGIPLLIRVATLQFHLTLSYHAQLGPK
ncbi:hypothetical protein E2C01_080231 [Portunus trituberculatus]|uniref:Uncharacterized protein n=1 Tax=Portunus trituberculatus TaxID=210409 RepID=A0A5B7ISV8_PORTR|nr:hypothetical protein [Portunus trituberculatus]